MWAPRGRVTNGWLLNVNVRIIGTPLCLGVCCDPIDSAVEGQWHSGEAPFPM